MPSTIDATKPLAGSLITSAEIRALALAAKTDIEELQSNQEAKANANLTINGQALTGNVTLTTANISDSTDKRYINDSQLASINNITQSSNHSALSNLNWTQSGHTGNVSTIAGFDANGTAQFLTTNGSGSVILSSNATLTNANLTTPSFINLTNANGATSTALAQAIGNLLYPVGCIVEFTVSTNPATLLGFGTWAAYGTGQVTVAIDSNQTEFNTINKTGGAKTHTLTNNEMPAHKHPLNSRSYIGTGTGTGASITTGGGGYIMTNTDETGLVGGGQAHNNLQPYIVVYRWVRTA